MTIGFIGLGNMGSAMIGGIIGNKVVKASDIIGADASIERVDDIVKKFGITAAGSNNAAAKADILVTSVKPQVYEDVIEDIKDTVSEDTVIISIAPGKTLKWLREKYGKPVKLVRCMPNTPALVGEGCTGVCRNELVSDEHLSEKAAPEYAVMN